MNSIKRKDLIDGFKEEDRVLPILNKHFNISLEKTGKYHIFDYINDKFVVELKKRNNKYNTYPTTMIPQNKINKMKEELLKGLRCVLVFSFLDGIYFIELNEQKIMKLSQNCKGGRSDRGIIEIKENGYCFIDIKYLTKITI